MGLFSRKKKKVEDPEQSRRDDDQKDEQSKDVVVVKKSKEDKPKKETKVKKAAAKKEKVVKDKDIKKSKAQEAYRVLIKPIISEKATTFASLNKYAFTVALNANKVQIKKAIIEVYGVMPISVNIINQRGDFIRFGKNMGRTKATKKAIVTLKKGDTIKLYEGI